MGESSEAKSPRIGRTPICLEGQLKQGGLTSVELAPGWGRGGVAGEILVLKRMTDSFILYHNKQHFKFVIAISERDHAYDVTRPGPSHTRTTFHKR
jgi:hypothetical protein